MRCNAMGDIAYDCVVERSVDNDSAADVGGVVSVVYKVVVCFKVEWTLSFGAFEV